MTISHRVLISLAPAIVAMIAGCAVGKNYSLGQEAEHHGDAHRAYDYYCKAAAEHPDSSPVVAAVKRVTPMAATYWESESLIAWSQGRHADAWRMAMRCLEIKPDHQGARQFVRKLEAEHPQTIESARRDWLAHGVAALAKAKPLSMELVSAAGSVEPTFDRDPAGSAPGAPATTSASAPTPSDTTARNSFVRDPAGSVLGAPVTTSAPAPTPSDTTARNSFDHDPTGSAPGAPATATKQKPTPTRATATNGKEPSVPDQSKDSADSKHKATPTQTAANAEKPAKPKPKRVRRRPRGKGAFISITTLSKRDRRFKRRARVVDGISIKLKDTDSELDADLDLYDGRRRTQKIRDLRTGRSKMFRGHSGKWYRLTILSIHHQTQTVRLGIGPA